MCCSFIHYKPPQPPQNSKAGRTVQQGSHEAIKHGQIKARLFIPGIQQEFFFFFITLQSFLLKYEWLCLSSVQIIYLCVSRPLVELSDLKYSEGLSVCHVCFVSTAFLSRSDVHLLAHYFGLFYCFELLQLHSRHTETSICVQLGTRKPYRRQSTSVSFLY